MDLWSREARLFKYGSGTGSQLLELRGEDEPLSGGGKSSGLMSFLKIGDRAAGAIKSGGTTRRAAKMVVPRPRPPRHRGVRRLEGRRGAEGRGARRGLAAARPAPQRHHRRPCRDRRRHAGRASTGEANPRAPRGRSARGAARRHDARETTSSACSQLADRAHVELDFPEYDTDWDGEAYLHRLRPELEQLACASRTTFFDARRRGRRLDAQPPHRRQGRAKTLRRATLWDKIAYAAWACADPGVQYDTTINEWHTCPDDGRINASQPVRDRRHARRDGGRLAPHRRAARPDHPRRRRRTGSRISSQPRRSPPAEARLPAAHALGLSRQAHRRPRVLTADRGDVAARDLTTDDASSCRLRRSGASRPRRRDLGLAVGSPIGDGCLIGASIRRREQASRS